MTLLNWFSACSLLVAVTLVSGCASPGKRSSSAVYEMRTYYAAPGKLEDLHARFRNHTLRLFEKHGMENVGYWVPVNNSENKLMFLLKYPSRAAREESWKSFMNDPEWIAAHKRSEENGKLVTKADQTFLKLTDYTPASKGGRVSKGGVFELRTYTTPQGKLPELDARFRNHTIGLFAKHGMNNWLYFHKTADQPNADTSLIYFLTHKSVDAAKASFDGFRNDPAWVSAKTASEKNGALTVKDGGVKSEFFIPTDYSPTK